MLGFFGGIIKNVIGRIVFMGLIGGGGYYFVQQNGGIGGVIELATSEGSPIAGMPVVAGLANMLPGGGAASGPDHFAQQGRISNVSVLCRLTLRTDGRMTRTQPMPCSRARAALADPQFAGYAISKTRTATYIYYAMDGVNTYTGTVDLTGATAHRSVGDVINLRVDSRNPRNSTPI